VVLGRNDTLHPEANQRWALEHFDDVRLVDSNHFIGWRDPGIVVEVILELMSRR
jgi:hypothetical protein